MKVKLFWSLYFIRSNNMQVLKMQGKTKKGFILEGQS